MKTLFFTIAFALCICSSSATPLLLDTLNDVHNNPAFQNLSHPDQLLVIELIVEAEVGELKAYIDSVGFLNVLALVDRLPFAERYLLTKLLTDELQKEEHPTTSSPVVVGRRSLVDVLNAAKTNPAFKQLSSSDQQLVIQILTEAENHKLTALIEKIGYGEVLRVLSILPNAEEHALEQYMYQHLKAEATALG